MRAFRFTTILAVSSAIALAACSSEPETADQDDVAVDLPDTDLDDIDATPIGGDLSDDQQANLDAMDRDTAIAEYDTNRQAMMADSGSSGSQNMSSGSTSGSGGMSNMPSRSQMDFAYLDRNGDGQLSVAEYAIWALPTDPTDPAMNDEMPPMMTQDEINEAGQTFFYFDEDGSTYLSQSEFQQARNSAMTS